MANYFRTLDPIAALRDAATDVVKQGSVYAAALEPELVVASSPVTLMTPLNQTDLGGWAYIAPEEGFAKWLASVEGAVADLAVDRAWFKGPDEAVRSALKTFFKVNGTFKVRVPDDLACFDAAGAVIDVSDVPAGATARVVLELPRVTFGRREYGAAWRIKQVRLYEAPVCLIRDDIPDDDDDHSDAADLDPDAQEFL
jgi:hypothetical protein